MGIDQATFEPILAISLGEFQNRLGRAAEALTSGDLAGLALHAHTLKSTAASMPASRHCCRTSSTAWAVTATMGTAGSRTGAPSGPPARMVRVAVIPSISGISMSMSTTS